MRKVIAIDHGNRMIKTPNTAFSAGFMESGHLPTMRGDVLVYSGKEYTLTEKRVNQKNDKTRNEDYFILTLFAIGKELLETNNKEQSLYEGEGIQVHLLIGLPPLHYRALHRRFEEYFKERGQISFKVNGERFEIEIAGVQAFPQAYSAAVTIYDEIKDERILNIVDIGGYTVDCLRLLDFKAVMDTCTSLYSGINGLFKQINALIRATGAQDLPDVMIEDILLNNSKALRSRYVELIREQARKYATDLLFQIADTGLDLNEHKTVFVGGGSALLKEYLMADDRLHKAIFIEDPKANAKGYKRMYDSR